MNISLMDSMELKAYQKFYPKSKNESAESSFREIVGISRVADYLKEKQSKTSNKLQITLEGQLLELNELRLLCKKEKRYNEAINALKEQNKLLGLYELDNKQKQPNIKPPKIVFTKPTDET